MVFTASTNIYSKCATVITKRNKEKGEYTHSYITTCLSLGIGVEPRL